MYLACDVLGELVEPRTVLLSLLVFLGVVWFVCGRQTINVYRYPPILPTRWSPTRAYKELRVASEVFRGLSQPHELFTRLSTEHGPVFCLWFPFMWIVVLNSYEAIREAFKNPLLNDRPDIQALKHGIKGQGIALSSGKTWKVQRKMVLNFMRDSEVNRASFEEKIVLEASHLNAELRQLDGQAVDLSHLLANAVSNVICSVVFGQRYDYSDPRFKKLLHAVYRNFAIIGGTTGPLQMLPFAYLLKPFLPVLQETEDNSKLINNFAREVIEEHQKNFDPDNPRDFIDIFLQRMAAATIKEDNNESILNVHNMCVTASDLLLGGTETTSTSIRWGLLYMMARPDILVKVQRELDAVVGRDRLPRISDRPHLPYTQATLMELQRVGNILPLGVPHQASEATTILGFDIPKGTIILSNMGALSTDSKLWENPETFQPERFLDETGRNVVEHKEHIPFSIGRRMCIGEQLAKMELFIFLTHLFHQFTIEKPEGSPPVSFKGVMGITLSPHPYKVCIIPRS